ncbi:hypothetical protein MAH1_35610 [Sessilibacter sp. MAH1]
MKLIPRGQYLQLNTPGIGKDVVFAPNVQEHAKVLMKAANRGYYYPLMAIKQLNALATGLTGKHNVFIPNVIDFKANSFHKVVVFVPGIAATVEKRSDKMLVITDLTLSSEYESIAKANTRKPGVYSVSRASNGKISAEFRNNGRIKSENHRNVVIANTNYDGLDQAAEEAVKRLNSMFGGDASLKCDFDLFYSPVGSRLNGMRNYNPVKVNQTYGFAGLLADAIEQSNNKKGVVWASERGGSVVLTQALMTLTTKNISFEEQKHIVKMCWATSNPRPAYDAIMDLDMIPDRNLFNSNSHLRASISAFKGNLERVKRKDDPYNYRDLLKSTGNGGLAFNTLAGAGVLVAGTALSGMPTGAIGVAGLVTGAVGGIQFAYSKFKERNLRR